MKHLEALTQLMGVSGYEDEVRDYLKKAVRPLLDPKAGDTVTVDAIGNLIVTKVGTLCPEKKIMASGHMDEVGLIINGIDDRGMLHFLCVGAIDSRILQSKRVLVGKNRLPGVIGSLAVHLQKGEQKVLEPEQLYIDIGCSTKEEAEKLVEPGTAAVFDSDFLRFGDGLVKARAMDNRASCALLLAALEERYPMTFVANFAVMEEIGCRGASVAAFRVQPDLGIALEATTSADMHGVEDALRVTRLGKGPAISIADHHTIQHRGFTKFIIALAEEAGIPWQYRQGAFGGTEAGSIQRARGGCPVANIAVPNRYIHAPGNVIAEKDFENAKKLLKLTLSQAHKYLEVKDA